MRPDQIAISADEPEAGVVWYAMCRIKDMSERDLDERWGRDMLSIRERMEEEPDRSYRVIVVEEVIESDLHPEGEGSTGYGPLRDYLEGLEPNFCAILVTTKDGDHYLDNGEFGVNVRACGREDAIVALGDCVDAQFENGHVDPATATALFALQGELVPKPDPPPKWADWPIPPDYADVPLEGLRNDVFMYRRESCFGDGLEDDYCRDGWGPSFPGALSEMDERACVAEMLDWESYSSFADWAEGEMRCQKCGMEFQIVDASEPLPEFCDDCGVHDA